MSNSFDVQRSLSKIAHFYRADEAACLEKLFAPAQLPPQNSVRAVNRATQWIESIRRTHRPSANVTDMLARFGLSSQEGLALMCLAEALLRIPDRATADALIRDKLNETHWNEALGQGTPWSINAAGWALSITGKIIQLEDPTGQHPGTVLGRLVSRMGQPLIREAIKVSMQWMADQFVTGETIEQALGRTQKHMGENIRFSFDMLGEGARTSDDAERYYQSYRQAIEAIGLSQSTLKCPRASGISVKLSALHPRYEMAHKERVMKELVPRLASLCDQAARYDIPLTIDAEESERLQLSLEIAENLMAQRKLDGWQGLGFAVQAYQKRAPAVLDHLIGLAEMRKQRIHIRLVKGAYWDSEIKRTQERGLDDFPVFTRKAGTDVSYLACARRMIDAMDIINPVFGTHNAMTVAHIVELAPDPKRIEFQRLHGMGDELHALMQQDGLNCCVYAPVGSHDVLLGYLVRRILENGANSSFVHRLLDPAVAVRDLTRDPVEELRSHQTLRHPMITRAVDLFGSERRNSSGLDLSNPYVTEPLLADMASYWTQGYSADSIIAGNKIKGAVDEALIAKAFGAAHAAYRGWSGKSVCQRTSCLHQLADLLEQHRAELMALLVREAGKTIPDALSEVREAVDFCRYYAVRAEEDFATHDLPGPTGERNQLRLVGRGVFVCISPWNFPLAIFLGQIAAALVAGNSVIAKPAPQTPMIAVRVTALIHQAGIPADVFHLVTGDVDVGRMLVAHSHVSGVAFTGSFAAARAINIALANKTGPIVPLIAETGGQNAMIVDSSALPEQVIDDVITSAFRSAGQRCSALRVLCLPESTADKILAMLAGSMRELRVGDSASLATDVGPVIDKVAQKRLRDHMDCLKAEAKEVASCELRGAAVLGTFIAPQVWEIPSISWLTGEVFGPILHVVRYRPENLSKLISDINATGFGLTGCVHSRIETTIHQVERELHVGNFYVNRSSIGAVVGSQPFGGEGLSGTGPKAGGPHYLLRFATERVTSINTTAAGGNASLLAATAAD